MQIVESFRNIFKIQELRRRIFITLGLLIVFRFGSHVVLPGVNTDALQEFQKSAEQSLGGLFHLMQLFSGQAIGNLALFALGIMPYITSSIIMQLMTKVSPTLEAMVKEGPAGQRKINQYTRYLAVPICLVQGIFAVNSLVGMQRAQGTPILYSTGFGSLAEMVIGLSAGALFVMWLGEQITEHGVGNGASLLIMAGIVSRLPAVGSDLVGLARKGAVTGESLVVIGAIYLAMIFSIVFMTQAQRRIPVQHAKHFRGRRVMMGSRNYLPLRVNTAGVMPVIFASSLLVIPQLLGQVSAFKWTQEFIRQGSFFYVSFYTVMIFFFSYFWTYLFFQPVEMANNLKEYGSFIPGIRPGENTANYLNSILSRITLCGAAFLAAVALMPDMVSAGFGGELQRQQLAFLGGTGILIVVGVGLDVIQKIESYLLMHHYEGFVGPGGVRGRR
ncbi:MAG: preprotein translocase subunit SecY [Planctomycetes bacterium]|nr:preprotein translocase subunit SecY [Planctomycetota bacterium]